MIYRNHDYKKCDRNVYKPIVLTFLVVILFTGCSANSGSVTDEEILRSFEELIRMVDSGEISEVIVYEKEDKLRVTQKSDGNEFWVSYKRSYPLTKKLLDNNVTLRSLGYGTLPGTNNLDDISFNEFVNLVDGGLIESVELSPKHMQAIVSIQNSQDRVSTHYLEDYPITDLLLEKSIDFDAVPYGNG